MNESRSQRRMQVLFFSPNWRMRNPYLDLLESGLASQNVEVTYTDFEPGLFPMLRAFRRHRGIKTLHLHFINQLIEPLCWNGSSVKRALRLLALRLDGFLVRAAGGQIVWTIHNLYRHESKNIPAEEIARRTLFQAVSKAVVHSEGARGVVVETYKIPDSQKLKVIPHGNYLQSYGLDQARVGALGEELGLQGFAHTFLFFGAVKEYKGLLDLIEAFARVERKDVCLVIAGKPDNAETHTKLTQAIAGDTRIILHLGFVPDDDVAPLFALSDAVVLPFKRILTSGSAVLAMSLAKAMVLPDDAEILGGVSEEGVQFYRENDIGAALEQILDRDTQVMGRHNLNVVSHNTWSEVGRQYRNLYENEGFKP